MKSKAFINAFILILSLKAWAGPSTGGGGYGVMCNPTPVSPATLELLDLYESEALNFALVPTTGDLKKDYFESAKRTYTIQGHPEFGDQERAAIEKNLRRTMQSVRFVDHKEDLPVAHDLGKTPWIPSQCSIEQIAYFDDQAVVIYVLRSAWNQLDTLGQAALLSHELFGHSERSLGRGATSEYARLAVAHIYAASGPAPLLNVTSGTPHFFTASGNNTVLSELYISDMVSITDEQRFEFVSIGGQAMLTQTMAVVPKVKVDFEYKVLAGDPSQVACVVKTPAIDQKFTVPVQGTMTPDYQMTYEIKTGKPIRLTFTTDSGLLSQEILAGDSGCQGL